MSQTAVEERPSWHAVPLEAVLEHFDASPQGLSNEEARQRLERDGLNNLPQQSGPTIWQIILRQFYSPLIYVLVAAAVVAYAVGDGKDALFIGIVLLINAIIGAYQEWKAEQSSRALQKLLNLHAMVLRDGDVAEIDAEQLVVGDIVLLESGGRVPADLRLISARGLEIDESFLTGESLPVHKEADWSGEAEIPLGDRQNTAFAGAVVIRGRGRGVVVATGSHTEVGRLALDVISATGGIPPLVERMERFSKMVAVIVVLVSLIIGVYGVSSGRYDLQTMFFFTVALAVSAIPEGLPAALTVALSVATARMAKRGVIVRRLTAVEGLGSCTLIASDKTGTLTCNELTAHEARTPDGTIYSIDGEGYRPEGRVYLDGVPVEPGSRVPLTELSRAAALCNEAELLHRNGDWVWHGDPTDVALLSFAHKQQLIREELIVDYPQVSQIPFEPEHQYSASFHRRGGEVVVYVKGAPERVRGMCHLSDEAAEELSRTAREMAAQGYRVLAFAAGTAPADLDESSLPPEPQDCEFLGLIGMIDPLRPGSKEAVEACQEAGITVWMVTGDHPVTALAISRNLGLADHPDQVLSGMDLANLTPEEVTERIKTVRVFARVAPHQKLQLVEAARKAGHFVAVTGDGVNDAPALRSANIGVAMGKSGTDVAREAAELVISDDNFATITAGVEQGRVAYENVRNVVFLLVSTGLAEVIIAALAIFFGTALPLLPVQLLWLNLVTNGIQGVALAFEPPQGDELKRKPRATNERIFNWLMIERTLISATVMGGVSFITFWWLLDHGYSEAYARNYVLMLMVLFENFHIGNCRSETKSAFSLSPLRSPILLGGAICALLLHLFTMQLGWGQRVLELQPIGLREFFVLAMLASTVLVASEIQKLIWKFRGRSHQHAA